MRVQESEKGVESAHNTLWGKFMNPRGFIQDFAGDLPAPEDCLLGRPNAIGWWSPIENASFFTGLYLDAMCKRAVRSASAGDKEKAGRLAKGLILCASVSDVPGFISRGAGLDGCCHYPLGSEDQTHPWFYGLCAYLKSGLASDQEKAAITGKIMETALALDSNGWRCPCDGAFKGQFRGQFAAGQLFTRNAVNYLFLLRMLYDISGDPLWLKKYHMALTESPEDGDGRSRLELSAAGFSADRKVFKVDGQMWIYAGCQGSLVRLAFLEHDENVRQHYLAGIEKNASDALPFLAEYRHFDNDDIRVFGHADWRAGYPHWFPQKTQEEAERLSGMGVPEKLGARKEYEKRYMRNPLAAAAIIAMSGNGSYHEEILRAIAHYDYSRLNMAEFFFAEIAYYSGNAGAPW
jgi:hypothetical protein